MIYHDIHERFGSEPRMAYTIDMVSIWQSFYMSRMENYKLISDKRIEQLRMRLWRKLGDAEYFENVKNNKLIL